MDEISSSHPSDSMEQRIAESEMLRALERQWKVRFKGQPAVTPPVMLDGFVDGRKPICVEVWARQGAAKGAQPAKVMQDICKLLYVEKKLGKKCRKVFAVCDKAAVAFLRNSWRASLIQKFDVEICVVSVCEDTRERVRKAQVRQFR